MTGVQCRAKRGGLPRCHRLDCARQWSVVPGEAGESLPCRAEARGCRDPNSTTSTMSLHYCHDCQQPEGISNTDNGELCI